MSAAASGHFEPDRNMWGMNSEVLIGANTNTGKQQGLEQTLAVTSWGVSRRSGCPWHPPDLGVKVGNQSKNNFWQSTLCVAKKFGSQNKNSYIDGEFKPGLTGDRPVH